MKYASIILDDNIEKTLDYHIPKELEEKIVPGIRVEVPIKQRFRQGFVFEIKTLTEVKKTKPIKKILSQTIISKELFTLALWMSKYYCCSLSKILKNMIPTSIRKNIKPKLHIFLSLNKTKKETVKICSELIQKKPLQAQVLELFLKSKKGFFLSDLLKITNSSKSPIDSLVKKKLLKSKKLLLDNHLLLQYKYFKTKAKVLNEEQQASFNKIHKSISSLKFEIHLIHGVTGSGKTEIYLQSIQKALDLNKNVIMLVPEIALTSQTIERFKARFDYPIAILHHRLSDGERFDTWQQLLNKKIRIVIGARSAIFCPLDNIGLIIVDEEHDSSYKQSEESPSYHGRNIAIMRAKLASCCVVLASATPSLESYFNALNKKYILSTLCHRAKANVSLPKVHIVDMKTELDKNKAFTHFSEKLLNGIKKRFDLGEQTMLFLNRRGYNNFLYCSNCLNTMKCLHCDLTLTFHKKKHILSCHSCGYNISPLKKCPICNHKDPLQYKGFGTEHVEASLRAIFPQIRTLRVDRDTTTKKNSHEVLFKQFRSGKADVLIGTQMIVKGLHFPNVSLVGVLNSDGALNIPDFRSSENVFQLTTQVAGRAGRDYVKGEVIIQTFMPNNPVLQKAKNQDYLSFYKTEIESRQMFDYPPFSSIVKVVFSSENESLAKNYGEEFRKKLIKILSNNIQIYPLIPCGRAKVKDKYKFQFLIKGKKIKILDICNKLKILKTNYKKPSSISIFIDVDPINTFF